MSLGGDQTNQGDDLAATNGSQVVVIAVPAPGLSWVGATLLVGSLLAGGLASRRRGQLTAR